MVTKQRTATAFSEDGIIVDTYDYFCLSTDEKPTDGVAVNSLLLELDTFKFYFFDGEAWQEPGGDSE